MNQKLSDWASISEIIASIAVVISLVVLIFEVRGNTEALQSTNRQSIAARTEAIALSMSENPELARMLAEGPSNDAESLQLVGYATAVLRNAEEAYLQYREGRLPEGYFRRRALGAIGVLRRYPGGWDWPVNRSAYDPEFVQYFDDALSDETSR